MAAPPPPPPPPPLPPSVCSPVTKLSAVPPFAPSLPPASKVPAPPPVKSYASSRANGPPPPPPPTQSHNPPVPQHSPKHKAKMGSSAPPPPPLRTTPIHHTSPVPSPSTVPPPPPLRTTPIHHNSPVPSPSTVPPPPPLRTTPIHHTSPVPSPSTVPPPPPLRTTPIHHTSPVPSPSTVPPPPPLRTTPVHHSSFPVPSPSTVPPPPPVRTTPVHHSSSPVTSPSGIPPPPVLRNSMSPTHGHSSAGDNAPPPPPMRHSRHSQESPIPPPPPRRSSITRRSINSSTPPQSPNYSHDAPPPPPTRSENTHVTTVPQVSPNIPPPPSVVQERLSGGSPSHDLQPSLVLNGYGDYDIPRPAREKNGYQDYDIPLSKKEREAKEKAMSMVVPGPQLHSSPVKQNSLEKEVGPDYSTPEDKGRKEKSYSLLTTQPRLTSESSSDSRPVSVTSSVYSADASSSSPSLNSSRCSSKLTIQKDDDYDIPKPSQNSQSTLDNQFEETIDQIFENMADQNRRKKTKNGGSPPDSGEPYHLQTSARSSFSNEENSSSRSGSNDNLNLGVWDDISYEEETEEEEETSLVKEVEDNGGNLLLDSWIKELESGIKGMEEVAGLVEPPTPLDITNEDAPPTGAEEVATPIQRDPPEQPPVSTEVKNEERIESVVKRRRTSKTEAEMARIATWRVSMKAIEDADDPDLDALLADLCQLEEDTKAQLASTTASTLDTGGDRRTVDLGGPQQPSNRNTESGMVSSEDFVQFMEGLQASKNIIPDVSGSLSMATYSTEQTRSAHKEDSPEIPQFDKESFDIFMGDTPAILRQNSRASMVPRQSSIPKQNSRSISLRRNSSRRPGDIPTGSSQSASPKSPSHKAVKKQLDAFAEQLTIDESLTPEQQVQKLKNEKLKIAMMKLKEASVQKMVLKVHNVDGSTKMVAIHQGMNAREVCILLAERNHQDLGPNWTLIEKIIDLHLERTLEDHEKVLDCLVHWPRGHNNVVLFKNNPEKYYLLKRPQMLMPSSHSYSSVNTTRTSFTEEQKKNIILKELFKNNILPKLEGELHIRDGKKSSWKKHLFVLRASGLYYSKSGKSLSSKDIIRVAEWKDVECYSGTQYKKFYRAPGNYCFSLVPNGPLNKVDKRIIHICVPTKHDLAAWMTGIRLAKHGVQLQQNYEDMKGEMPWLQLEDENLDMLARKVPEAKPRESRVTEAEPVVLLQNGKEINPQDLADKKKGNSMRGSFQLKITENGTAKAPETLRVGSGGGHSISGPLLQEPQTGSMRRNRSNQSILASAFQNAWKQGTMAAEMSQDTEKWPVFNQLTSKQKARSHETLKDKESLPYVEEEMSGMFTLKRKKDKEKQERNGKNGSTPSTQIPRTASLGSRPADSSEPKNRMSQASIQTTLF